MSAGLGWLPCQDGKYAQPMNSDMFLKLNDEEHVLAKLRQSKSVPRHPETSNGGPSDRPPPDMGNTDHAQHPPSECAGTAGGPQNTCADQFRLLGRTDRGWWENPGQTL